MSNKYTSNNAAIAAIKSFSGDKSSTLEGAVNAVYTASVSAMMHGGKNGTGGQEIFSQSLTYLSDHGALVKGGERKGETAKTKKGDLYGRLMAARRDATNVASQHGGKAPADVAAEQASIIADAFRAACESDATVYSEKGKASAAKRAEKAKSVKGEAAPITAEEKTGASVLTLAQLLDGIRKGEAYALGMAQTIRGTLNEFEAAQAELIAQAASKAKAASKAGSKAA